jgi:hypothetical protein
MGRGGKAARNVFLVFLAGLAQVHVHVGEARQQHLAVRLHLVRGAQIQAARRGQGHDLAL